MAKRSRAAAGEEEVEVLETENNNVADFLLLLSHGVAKTRKHYVERTFECKTCHRQFPSFQALGGHCATHKRWKAAEGSTAPTARSKKPRTHHECAVCGMVFSMGQALGGHMRRHKPPTTDQDLVRSRGSSSTDEEIRTCCSDEDSKLLLLDLNLPPPEDHDLKLTDFFFILDRSLRGGSFGIQSITCST